jgi:DNA-binding MarR family transcriptional regulator
MSYKHYNAAVDELELYDGANERYFYLECCYRADSKGRVLIPQTTLAEITRLSLRTIASLFQALESKGLVEKLQHGQYRVTISPQADNAIARLRSKETQPTTTKGSIDDELPELTPLEEWWENNAKLDENSIECVPIPIDEVPDFVIQAVKDGQLKRRVELVDYKNDAYWVYERS